MTKYIIKFVYSDLIAIAFDKVFASFCWMPNRLPVHQVLIAAWVCLCCFFYYIFLTLLFHILNFEKTDESIPVPLLLHISISPWWIYPGDIKCSHVWRIFNAQPLKVILTTNNIKIIHYQSFRTIFSEPSIANSSYIVFHLFLRVLMFYELKHYLQN